MVIMDKHSNLTRQNSRKVESAPHTGAMTDAQPKVRTNQAISGYFAAGADSRPAHALVNVADSPGNA